MCERRRIELRFHASGEPARYGCHTFTARSPAWQLERDVGSCRCPNNCQGRLRPTARPVLSPHGRPWPVDEVCCSIPSAATSHPEALAAYSSSQNSPPQTQRGLSPQRGRVRFGCSSLLSLFGGAIAASRVQADSPVFLGVGQRSFSASSPHRPGS